MSQPFCKFFKNTHVSAHFFVVICILLRVLCSAVTVCCCLSGHVWCGCVAAKSVGFWAVGVLLVGTSCLLPAGPCWSLLDPVLAWLALCIPAGSWVALARCTRLLRPPISHLLCCCCAALCSLSAGCWCQRYQWDTVSPCDLGLKPSSCKCVAALVYGVGV